MKPAAKARTRTLIFAILARLAFTDPALASSNEGVSAEKPEFLEAAKVLRRQFLNPKEVHRFALRLRLGEFAHVVIKQLGLDVEVSVVSPRNELLIRMDTPTSYQDSEEVSCIADIAGDYLVEVRIPDESDLQGAYEIAVPEIRRATDADRTRLDAERRLAEANQLVEAEDAASYQKAIERLEGALPIWQDLHSQRFEAMTLFLMARARSRLYETRAAVELYSRALLISRAIGDHYGEALVLFGRGTDRMRLQDPKGALEDYEPALALVRSLGIVATEAEIATNIGDVQGAIGENARALETYRAALPLMRSSHDRNGEFRVTNNIGILHDFLGEKQKALDSHSEALRLARAMGSRQSEAVSLMNLGRLYGGLGETEKGRDLLRQSQVIFRSLGDRRREALSVRYLGESYADEGDTERSLEVYAASLPLFKLVSDGHNEGRVLNAIGENHAQRGDLGQAETFFEQALALAEKVDNRFLEAVVRTNRGVVLARRGEKDRALAELNRALALRSALGDRPGQAETRFEIARVERDRGDLDAASKEVDALLSLAESLRVEIASPDLRASFFSRMRKYYGVAIDVSMRMCAREPAKGFDARALEIAEHAKARSLLDVLTESRSRIHEGADPALLERQSSLANRLAGKIDRRVRLQTANPKLEQSAGVDAEIEDLRAQLEAVGRTIRETSPRYANLVDPHTLTSSAIQSDLLDGETVLLEYFLGDERSFLWVASKNAIATYELPPRRQVEDVARRVYELLTARNLRPKAETAEARKHRVDQADAEYPVAAAALSRMLLGPAEADLAGRRLVIVADGALQYVPFAALPDPAVRHGGFEPLTLRHELASLPSASALAVLRNDYAGRSRARKTLVVLADPVFDRSDERVRPAGRTPMPGSEGIGKIRALPDDVMQSSLLRSARDAGLSEESAVRFARLPFTRREARGILDRVPPNSRKEALDFDASRATATSPELSGYRFVHFATHGLLDSSHPESSGLVFSLVDREGRDQPGFLGAADVFNLKLGAELVVLSGCQTALGRDIRGEGLLGLTRAFMYAGAPRVAASLWKVDDVATAELMTRFYDGMLGRAELRPAAALRAAQISMWKENRWKAPYYWAAFVLQGEWK